MINLVHLLLTITRPDFLRALGIESLGDEILSSYNALIGNYRDAFDPTPYRVIMEPMDGVDHAAFRVMMESRKGAVKVGFLLLTLHTY